jgi:hypothetical protein
MDISNVNINKNNTPCMCYGKTFRGKRCKIKSHNTYKCYGLELPVCKYHERQNVIYRWSLSRKTVNIPEKIRTFLAFYSHCVTVGINHWLALVITAEVYNRIGHASKDEIIELFQSIVFRPTSGECSVCYDSPNTMLKTRCGHMFCKICLVKWMETNITCPMCRKIISQE